jgi:hypothetical protein
MPRDRTTSLAVLRYMRSKPGLIMHYSDVASDLNVNASNVNSCLVRCVTRNPEYGITREGQGQYLFSPDKQGKKSEATPDATPMGEVYELVGQSKDGTRVVRDSTGVLWKLTERL